MVKTKIFVIRFNRWCKVIRKCNSYNMLTARPLILDLLTLMRTNLWPISLLIANTVLYACNSIRILNKSYIYIYIYGA